MYCCTLSAPASQSDMSFTKGTANCVLNGSEHLGFEGNRLCTYPQTSFAALKASKQAAMILRAPAWRHWHERRDFETQKPHLRKSCETKL